MTVVALDPVDTLQSLAMSEAVQHRVFEHEGFKFDVWRDDANPCMLRMKLRDPDPQATYKHEVATIEAVVPPPHWRGKYDSFKVEWDGGKEVDSASMPKCSSDSHYPMRKAAIGLLPDYPQEDNSSGCERMGEWMNTLPSAE